MIAVLVLVFETFVWIIFEAGLSLFLYMYSNMVNKLPCNNNNNNNKMNPNGNASPTDASRPLKISLDLNNQSKVLKKNVWPSLEDFFFKFKDIMLLRIGSTHLRKNIFQTSFSSHCKTICLIFYEGKP